MKDIACKIILHGMVTGVGFRYYALREAGRFDKLRGHVRNIDDRTVECVLQGPEQDVRDMTAKVRRGPAGARVTECHVNDIPTDPNRPFFHVAY
jgi:acylphosphatase